MRWFLIARNEELYKKLLDKQRKQKCSDPHWFLCGWRLTLYGGDDIIREVQLLQAGKAGEGVPTHRLDGVPGQAQAPQLL